MHTFQTYPSDMFEIDPFTKIGSDWMLITSGNKEKANALTSQPKSPEAFARSCS